MAKETHWKPRIGIPWRTRAEELERNVSKLNHYFDAVRSAGADPEHISLARGPQGLPEQLARLDGFVLPGSPADVDPARYGEPRHPRTQTVDPDRDRTDSAILAHALEAHKPVLAICYGCQMLNVHQGGSLLQDIPSERPASVPHGKTDLAAGATSGDLAHGANLSPGSLLERLAGGGQARINSSHHQAIAQPGKGLLVTALGSDGIIEGVELDSPGDWVVGVQWHPERMPGDRFAEELFHNFVEAARKARLATAGQG